MRLSLSGFLFEDDYRTQSVAFEGFCAIAAGAGYEGVELRGTQVNPDTPEDQVRRVREIVQARGLAVTCLTARGLPDEPAERDAFLDRYLHLCRRLSCGLLKIGGPADWLRVAAGRAEAFGVALARNNHVGGPLETVAGTLEFLAAVGHRNFGLLYDCLHLAAGGEDYLGAIETFGPYVRNVLVQCGRRREAGPGPKPDIDGDTLQNWPAVLAELKRVGYDGWVTVIENGRPAETRAWVARHWAEVIRGLWGRP